MTRQSHMYKRRCTDLNALISSIDDEHVWELFDEMCDLILGFVVDETIKTDPS